jgi:hypothetical protein
MTKKKVKSNYLLDNATTYSAMEVANELFKYLRDKEGLSSYPIPHLIIANDGLIVMLGDVPVWNTDDNTLEELSVTCCIDSYRDHVKELLLAVGK